MLRKKVSPALVVSGLAGVAYALSAVLAAAVGFRFWVPWVVYQLLDAAELRRAPWMSLLALHAQPPALNALLAAALRLGDFLGCGPEPLLAILFFVLGGVVVVLLARLVHALTGSVWLALAAVLFAVADPALHVYRTVFFYELPLAALLLVALAAAWRFLSDCSHGGEGALLLFVAATGGMCLTRSLYHPLWAVAMFALLLLGRMRLTPDGLRRRVRGVWLRSAVVLALLLGFWPLKNALLFGAPVMTSWQGYNLARGTAAQSPPLWSYLATGTVPEPLHEEWRQVAPAFLRDAPVLAAPEKSDGGRNWNHYVFLLTDRELTRDALRWRREHPGAWLRQSLANYLLWGRASYLDSYWESARGPDNALYRGYARWHERLLFPDLRGAVVRLTPGAAVHADTTVWGGPAPYTLFALVGLPALLVILAVLLPRCLRSDPAAWVALLAAVTLLWVLIVPCLTDGTEGNRMRYPVSPCVLLLAAWSGAAARRAVLRSSGSLRFRPVHRED